MEISVDWKSHLLVEYSKNKFTCEVMDGQIQDERYRVNTGQVPMTSFM